MTYAWLVNQIQTNVNQFPGKYSFLEDYNYKLGADQLTEFGQEELYNSGLKFYNRYKPLTRSTIPFIRAGAQDRVVDSAQSFAKGFHSAKSADKSKDELGSYPYPILEINEDPGSNNTLHHSLCNEFEDGSDSELASDAQKIWLDVFTPPITARLNRDLEGVDLNDIDTIHFMDLCPFNTVATKSGVLSPFCELFTIKEWHQYDYFQSLGKYYGYANGHPLGPTQGVGFTNELIARMTNSPVVDHTSVNQTLDRSNITFPPSSEIALYADFSHDKYAVLIPLIRASLTRLQ